MTKFDYAFSIFCGLAVAWLGVDLIGIKYGWLFFVILPIFSVFCLWLSYKISHTPGVYFVKQAARFVLVGSFASVVDIKVYQLVFWLIPVSLPVKAFSYVVGVASKFWGNKHWVFEKHEKGGAKEIFIFLAITLFCTGLNVLVFYCATHLAIPHFGISTKIWTEISIIFASVITSAINFLGYKILVFKK